MYFSRTTFEITVVSTREIIHIPVPALGKDKLEDLTVLKRSPDLLNNVKIGQDQLRLIMKYILFYGGSSDLKQSNEYSIKQPSDF